VLLFDKLDRKAMNRIYMSKSSSAIGNSFMHGEIKILHYDRIRIYDIEYTEGIGYYWIFY